MIPAPKPAAWLLLPDSGAFDLKTFWLGSVTSESLRDFNDDGTKTEVEHTGKTCHGAERAKRRG